jgi:RHS repeat-associated protein
MCTFIFNKKTFFGLLLLAVHLVSVLRGDEEAAPGWIAVKPLPLPTPISPGKPFPNRIVKAAALSGVGPIVAQAAVAYSGASATAITSELQALATGLNNDPVKIFNYVRNKIEYQPYYGCNKGAHVTYLDGAGNDMDQAALLIALLNQAGATATSFVYGKITVRESSTDGNNLGSWLGLPPAKAQFILYNSGTPFDGGIDYGDYITWTFDHVWVRATINGTTYDLDPSFKQNQIVAAIDYKTASGYSRSQLLTDAGGTTTSATDFIQSLNRSAVETRLANYTTTLNTYLKANYPNAETVQVIGGKNIIENSVAALTAGAPLAEFSPEVTTTFTTIPSQYVATYQVKIDSDIDVTFPVPALQGKRLSIVFSGSNAQLWLGDQATPVASQTTGSGTTASVVLSIVHPYANLNQNISAKTYTRTGSYDLTYALFPNPKSNGLIDASSRQLQTYLASGLTDTSRQVLTETLHGLGLKWVRRVALETGMIAQINGLYGANTHIIGRTGQESGYYVDMPGVSTIMYDDSGTDFKAFNASGFVSSAMEHGVIEQTGGSASLSTIKCLVLANDGSQKIYKATASNYASVVSPALLNYSAAQKTSFSTSTSGGSTILLHQNGQTTLNQWTGFGYASLSSSYVAMTISGGYSGGYSSVTGTFSGTLYDDLNESASDQYFQLSNLDNPASPEPVDLLTGAYTLAQTDLALGETNSPRGLGFTRSYDSTRNFATSPLGNGWRHSYEGKIILTSEVDNAFGLTQPRDAAQTLIGLLAVLDFTDTTYSPKELMVGVLAANWTVNRILNNAANVQLGEKRLTYISQPNGSWNPPPGSTTALTGTTGTFALQPRFGGSLTFDAQNRLSQWRDVDNNTLTLAYHATTGRLTTVTDAFGRTLTFTYYTAGVGNGLLQSVQDSTGRSVQYTYTAGTFSGANLTGITDPEAFSTTLVYDSRNRLTDWKDHSAATITHNDYDAFDRVSQQLSQGLVANTWLFQYSPGLTVQIDPQGGTTTHLFDTKNRHVGTIDALGHATSQTYDGQNHIVLAKDATGRQTTATYDSNQNLTQNTDNAGRITTFLYDASLRLWKVTDATSRITVYGYDSENHLTSVADPGSRLIQYAYRADGLLASVIDPANHTTTISSYDARGNPTLTTRSDGTTTSATYNARGDRLSFTDGRGYTTTFTYDNRRLPKSRTDARSGLTQWTYDSNGNPATVTDRNAKVTTTVFDNLGKLKTVLSPETGLVTSSYDSRDWLTSVTDGLSHTTSLGYDSTGRRTTATNALAIQTAKLTYDEAGRVSTQANGLNQTTQFAYDTVGRLDHTIDPLNLRVDHTYDFAGRKLTLQNRRGLTFSFGYATDGLAKTFNYPSGRQSQIVNRDAVGRPQTLQSPSGNQTALTYDNLGRVKTQTDPVSTLTWTYDNEGNPTNLAEGSTNIARTFDQLGRVTNVTDTQGNAVAYTYDAEGNLLTLTYPGSKTVTYTYDGSSRLKTVTDWAGRVTTYAYDTAGRLQTVARPNNTRQRVTFDAANRLTASYEELMSGLTVSGTLWQATYGFDNADRLTSFNPSPMAKTKAPPTVALTYNSDNQLATYNGASVASDLDGNLTTAPVGGTLLGVITWDVRNRLVAAGGVTYTYDAENRRVTRTQGGQVTRYIWSRGARLDRLLATVNPDGSVTRYIYGNGLLAEETTTAGGVAQSPVYYHFDWRGDTVALSDSSGTVTARLSYTPFGERTVETGTVTTPFGFNGRWGVLTEPTELLYMQARFYSPVLKRFLSEDPAGFSGGMNLYAFAGGNPVDMMDPFGLGPVSTSSNWGISNFVSKTATQIGNAATNFIATVGGSTLDRVLEGTMVGLTAIPRRIDAAVAQAGGGPTEAAAFKMALGGAFSQMSMAGAATSVESTALSTFRRTTADETFQHYGYAEQAGGFSGGLRPGGFATTVEGLSGAQARSGLALPHATPPNAVYTVTPQPGTWVRVNPVSEANFGQPGGLPEFQFPNGTGAGTVSGPNLLH